MRSCATCGVRLLPDPKRLGRPRLYCSSVCAERSRRVGARGIQCSRCGCSFTAGSRGPLPTLCVPCRRSPKSRVRQCDRCGREFVASSGRFCSAQCRQSERRAKTARPVEYADRPCAVCGTEMSDAHPLKRFCSERCARASRQAAMSPDEADAARRRKQARWQARKARKLAATVGAPFSIEDAVARDGWICGICRELIAPDLRHPDPQSLSMDHIRPLSKGGAHSLENVQPAHLLCNTRKRDREEATWLRDKAAAV